MFSSRIYCAIFICSLFWIHAYSDPGLFDDAEDKQILESVDFFHGEDFKSRVSIERAEEQCYFQFADEGSVLYVHFHVYRGGDRTLSAFVFTPSGKRILEAEMKYRSTNKLEITDPGYHKICFDNSHSSFTTKFVDLHIATWSDNDWEQYQEAYEQFQDSADVSTRSMSGLRMQIRHMKADWGRYKTTMNRDEIIVQNLGNLVNKVSFTLCALVLMTSGFQVFFLRRLFLGSNVKGKA
ncbi:hypothetical protein CAPTEDRAFT_184467 [Capitella teleta]|uniref:GOLD domain-containing protein n=1 Tax=Capitella teleta TaxID=283909 RepID=R7VM51_CAPTE|nr:hypothetical protein CAPTEDRAFT_184467 [Capitella teleta]|eukprot:ELU18230.1 hypothetical protein CAPTEDRAFT_184467 [Capitella teleta]